MSAVVLVASCGDIYEAQADIYDEYKAKVDTATSHKSLKELNDALEYEIVALLKEDRERVVDAAKEGKKFKDSEKALAKAEANYVNAYLDKVVRMIVSEQKDKFIEYTQNLLQQPKQPFKVESQSNEIVTKLCHFLAFHWHLMAQQHPCKHC